MSLDYQVVTSSVRHVRPMARQLRAAACITLQGFGLNPHSALHNAFIASSYCRTALVDGKPVAMWGVKDVLLSDQAAVWLVLSDFITQMPVAIVREARQELARVMETKREVAITVLPNDEAAIRFAVYLGFHDRENDDGQFSRKDLCHAVMTDPKYKIPVGDHYVVALGYHPTHGH